MVEPIIDRLCWKLEVHIFFPFKSSLKPIRMMIQNCGKEEKLNEKREVKN